MKLFHKIVDERQELEMLRVERVSFWVMFFGLAVVIFVQLIAFDLNIANIMGEFIVLMTGCVVMLIGDIRRGSWDYFTKPGMKAYLIYSIVGSLIFAIIMPLIGRFRYNASILGCLKFSAIYFAIMFPVLFLVLWFFGSITKKRQAKLQQEFEEESQ